MMKRFSSIFFKIYRSAKMNKSDEKKSKAKLTKCELVQNSYIK